MFVQTDKTRALDYGMLNPHYSDDRFRRAQTVFLAPGYKLTRPFGSDIVEEASYDYSDRLHQFHGDKNDEAWKAAEAKGLVKNSPALLEAYLQELFGDPNLQLVHLVTGVNVGNGYPYHVYGYIRGKKDESATLPATNN